MTSVSPSSTDQQKRFSTDQGTVYLTGNEIAAIEADPVLEIEDVVQYRAGGDEA